MSQLIKYEAACTAIAECKAVDEVKAWADKAAAMQAYGRMAKDKTLEVDAAEIRIRAERRLGELISAQKASAGLNSGAAGLGINQYSEVRSSETTAPKLADMGISKDLSSRSQKLAAVPEAEFESEVGEWRDRVKAEGARVTSRLEKAGERALKKEQAPAPSIPEGMVLYPKEEFEENLRLLDETRKDNESMVKVFESDSQLDEAVKEIRRLNALVTVLEERNRGMMNECNEAKRLARSWKNKFEKLERETKDAGLVDF
jgi:hypothetical protein